MDSDANDVDARPSFQLIRPFAAQLSEQTNVKLTYLYRSVWLGMACRPKEFSLRFSGGRMEPLNSLVRVCNKISTENIIILVKYTAWYLLAMYSPGRKKRVQAFSPSCLLALRLISPQAH